MKTLAKRILSLLLVLSFCVGTVGLMPANAANKGKVTGEWSGTVDPSTYQTVTSAAAPMVSCRGMCLMDMDTGEVLYSYNKDGANYPASTTKIMTAYLCIKYGNLSDYTTVTYSAMTGLSDASLSGIVVGERYSIESLLKCMLIVSGCDAANVIGEYIAGSCSNFVALMNKEAKALGCTNTHFANCHGVPTATHYTSAADMAKIAAAAMNYEAFRNIVCLSSATIPATNLQGARVLYNTNKMLPNSGKSFAYRYCTGIKTGSSNASGYCLVSSAEKDGRRLVCVMLGAGSGDARFTQSKALLEWGFEQEPTKIPDKPAIESIENEKKGISLSWSSCAGAAGYTIYRKASTGGGYTCVAKLTGADTTTYLDKNIKNGVFYIYSVRSYNAAGRSSSVRAKLLRVAAEGITSLQAADKSLRLTWRKNSKADTYEIEYSTDPAFNRGTITTCDATDGTSLTVTGLRAGKTYYVRVRTWGETADAAYYGAWSTTKSITMAA